MTADSYISDLSKISVQSFGSKFPRSLVLLGSTGSIGQSAIKVIQEQKEKFNILALAAGQNVELLAKQAMEFFPPFLAVLNEQNKAAVRQLLPENYQPEILVGSLAYSYLAKLPEADLILSAQVGAAGLAGTWAAVEAGKVIALANKESLVLAGSLLRKLAKKSGALILPVDSEHNAIFQVYVGHNPKEVKKIILTASGGPFRGYTKAELEKVSPTQALKHPNWNMGAKISIDSATLMNKGLEVIEACHLYGQDISKVEVIIHPQSIIHSIVEYCDASMLAQMGPADMRLAIAYCLGWPKRIKTGVDSLSLSDLAALTFEQPDLKKFPCLALAVQAFLKGKGYSIVLNAANEVAVKAFLQNKIKFTQISELIDRALDEYIPEDIGCLEEIIMLDKQIRQKIKI